MTVPGSGDLIGDPAPAATGAAEAAGGPLLLRSLRRNRRLVLYTDIYSLLNGFLGLWEC